VSGSAESLGLAPGTAVPASVTFKVRPELKQMSPFELTMVDIVRTNQWKRPLTFSVTGGEGTMAWLAPYARLDGLYWRIVPTRDAKPDLDRIRAHLLGNARYRGYADSSVRLDDFAGTMAMQTYYAAEEMLKAEHADSSRCRNDLRSLVTALPPDRLPFSPAFVKQVTSACGPAR
jgi:hypothetical protein